MVIKETLLVARAKHLGFLKCKNGKSAQQTGYHRPEPYHNR